MYFKDDGFFVGKKIGSKPYESLCEAAQWVLFFACKKGEQKESEK